MQGVTESKDLGISYLSERVKVYGNVLEIYDDIEGEQYRPIDNVEVKIIVVSDTGQKDTYKCVTDQYGYFEMFTKTNRHGVMTYWKDDLIQYVCNIDIAHEDLDKSLRIRLDAWKVSVDLKGGSILDRDIPTGWTRIDDKIAKSYYATTKIQAIADLWSLVTITPPSGMVFYK